MPVRGTDYPIVKVHDDISLVLNGTVADYQDASARVAEWIAENGIAVLHIVRDGRAVLASYHRFLKGLETRAHCTFSQFIRQEHAGESRVRRWASLVRSAMSNQDVTVIKYEDIISNPKAIITQISQRTALRACLTQPLLPPKTKSIWEGRLNRIARFKPKTTTILGYQKEPLESWKSIMDENDQRFFNKESDGLLFELNYETAVTDSTS